VAVLALMVLYFLTAVSVVTFFARTKADTRLWQTRIAPGLAGLMILGVTYLVIANFTTLIGGNTRTAVWLMVTVPVVFVLGLVLNAATKSHAHRWRPGQDPAPAVADTAAPATLTGLPVFLPDVAGCWRASAFWLITAHSGRPQRPRNISRARSCPISFGPV